MPRNRASLFATDSRSLWGAQCTCQCHFVWCSNASTYAANIDWLVLPVCPPYQLMWQNPEKNMCEWFSPFRLILPSAWEIGWWKTIHIRSFHSSVLILEHSPSAERLIIPLVVLNPKDISKCGPPSRVRWAESGGWHDASWNDLPLDVWPTWLNRWQNVMYCPVLFLYWPCFFFFSYVLSYVLLINDTVAPLETMGIWAD